MLVDGGANDYNNGVDGDGFGGDENIIIKIMFNFIDF